VWTEHMLETLERGVKGGKWHSLIDKVYQETSLRAGWARVESRGGTGGVDKVSIAMFGKRLDK